jgi:hypothetical protein
VTDKFTLGRRRRRAYARQFDWLEARARHAAGESFHAIARALGVDRRSVARVVKLPEQYVEEASQEQIELLARMPRDRVPCPRCMGPMTREASLCASCHNETRVEPMTLRTIAGTGDARIELREVELHRIVEVDGSWGVVIAHPEGKKRYRVVDFWDGGPEFVHGRTRVRVARTTQVLVGGIPEGGEEIE